jgi:hypothetical protein
MWEKIGEVILIHYGPVVAGLLIVVAALWLFHVELTKVRLEMRYEVNRDLLARRFEAYGALWSRTSFAAIYTAKEFGPDHVTEFKERLSSWYFTEKGGLLLTTKARGFYFALQDFLTHLGDLSGWHCPHRPSQSDTKVRFARLLKDVVAREPQLQEQVNLVQTTPETLDPEIWKHICKQVAVGLADAVQRVTTKAGEGDATRDEVGRDICAAVQQVSSVLRSKLAAELRSRLDVERPEDALTLVAPDSHAP